ncbi:MAG: tRNA glutamyl-Q(34) synthetase GluQRS [Nannocystaceae bacterium]|nr:tRNA glutamyl-Q(34) synthetase GluQRS [Nannocystaceae bacterium]
MFRPIRGRYAPSPTGRLHLGNVRTALLSWLQIRALGGTFVVRIEDVDTGRSRPGFEATMLEDLRWLGLDWDEGPVIGGSRGPYRQSSCMWRYADALAQLETFECTCTRKEVRAAAGAQGGAEPVYPGTCTAGPTHPQRARGVRWLPPDEIVEVTDARMGTLTENLRRDAGSFLLRRTDGDWAYNFAVVVDDGFMGITHTLRGADLWTSTPRQVGLAHALGLRAPAFTHAPLLCGPDGEKLSKRHGAPDVAALREASEDPKRVIAWLARSVGLVPQRVQTVTADELVADFAVEAIVDRPLPPSPDPWRL